MSQKNYYHKKYQQVLAWPFLRCTWRSGDTPPPTCYAGRLRRPIYTPSKGRINRQHIRLWSFHYPFGIFSWKRATFFYLINFTLIIRKRPAVLMTAGLYLLIFVPICGGLHYRFAHWGDFLARFNPNFFLSLILGSLVK